MNLSWMVACCCFESGLGRCYRRSERRWQSLDWSPVSSCSSMLNKSYSWFYAILVQASETLFEFVRSAAVSNHDTGNDGSSSNEAVVVVQMKHNLLFRFLFFRIPRSVFSRVSSHLTAADRKRNARTETQTGKHSSTEQYFIPTETYNWSESTPLLACIIISAFSAFLRQFYA